MYLVYVINKAQVFLILITSKFKYYNSNSIFNSKFELNLFYHLNV
jgi:hypothetical protein